MKNLVQYRCSNESVMRLWREFYEFIAASKMPREVPQYFTIQRSQNMKMSFKFSPNIVNHKESLYKLTIRIEFFFLNQKWTRLEI